MPTAQQIFGAQQTNGKVTEHRDYADYRVFTRQYEAQTSNQ